ncbi:predicted protein [Brucella suis bv. 3 str. 686]|uniref:Uncharacterized protein n=2 Tax=Brucella TaxID=234 RepID=A9M934_BRUC2|nr:Hypothetical protein BCAN_A0520 [Brucella canis ATCC 23365]EEW88691.1 predicted protein [Brucella melitensis bv. 1 str. 16M]EEX82004.1 predicted protein [Brucella abortus bv. 3 str. Tulya]EEX90179.1 predicted protein [Brucella ceti M13/05/1]EEX99906.1 predicted protein [Brucella pinnipedialis B2/94]EEY25722.1 predicted protein [Brucella sp. F5/99]EEY29535.1 predicted protein [Brucella suis bv. 5 str. 513]EEY32191.1 predicted protein [Brucella suis bv. 3 str. 686]
MLAEEWTRTRFQTGQPNLSIHDRTYRNIEQPAGLRLAAKLIFPPENLFIGISHAIFTGFIFRQCPSLRDWAFSAVASAASELSCRAHEFAFQP